jgi:translation initiation factor 2 subunit 1
MTLEKKQGFPEEGELVLCTVTSVQFHSVFVQLDEYGKTGMIHISEVAPGRIRNIRDFVIEGKKVVCKVLKVHLDRGHIDLSLRRVTEMQKRQKITALKQQQNAEKILEHVAKSVGSKPDELFAKVNQKAVELAGSLYGLFQEAVKDESILNQISLSEKERKVLLEVVTQRVKAPEVEVVGKLKVQSYAPDGVEHVKNALKAGLKSSNNSADVKYLGSGTFRVAVKAPDYKEAEKILDKFVEGATDSIRKQGVAEFQRAV